MPLRFGKIILTVYRGEIQGISVTVDIQRHERDGARAEPPDLHPVDV